MKQYLKLLQTILDEGESRDYDRTGTGTIGIFGPQMRFDLREGFPLLTTKKLHLRSIIYELLWFIKGDTNIKYLNDNGVTIWDEWADENGDLGPIYGKQWRDFNGVDQLSSAISRIKDIPDDRRHVVSAWNPEVLPLKGKSFSENVALGKAALPPCHLLFQFYAIRMKEEDRLELLFNSNAPDFAKDGGLVDEVGIPKYWLDLQMYQRSCDTFLGVPFNIASYSLLLMMVAQVTNSVAREFIWTGGDTHLYLNHINQAKIQIMREPRKLPEMIINPKIRNIEEFSYEDFELKEYYPHPYIKGEISI